ncbi:MAG: DUF2461 domain-containing protein [Tabrizicola sp.]|nr:DUF2461 domain-containing protein [Tabrizicola sp.]
MGYNGLPSEAFAFLRDLAAHNDRDWFEAHRAEYEAYWLQAGLDLIAALGPFCSAMTPRPLAVPKLNQSLRRIHRDTRFSKDKTPYQPWLHVILSTGPEFNKVPGLHIVLTPEGLGYGAGQYGLEPSALGLLRQRICDPKDRARLLKALDAAEAVQSTLDPTELARVPKGYEADPEWDHLLRRKSLIVRTQTNLPPPDWLFTAQAPEQLAAIARAHLPLLAWLLAQ